LKNRTKGFLLAAGLALGFGTLAISLRQFGAGADKALSASGVPESGVQLILDAGHGGEDGGAVSLTGCPESEINLAIVRKMDDLLAFYGVPHSLLRQEDISLHDSDAVTLREKKVSDLKNRVAAIQNTPNAVLLSIHQNSYPEQRYHGAQSFYAPTDGSQPLAQHIQTALQTALQPENSRQAKQIPDTVYLMNHIDCPAVLVECGFLTNPEEEALLRQDDYQKKLSVVLCAAWLTAPESTESA
jgi:N-acetylmuramoyl-L-alanine amidase